MNVTIVEFFPLRVEGLQLPPPFGEVFLEPEGVLRGAVSDDLCASRPCLHNATCANTWNDYTSVLTHPHDYCRCTKLQIFTSTFIKLCKSK